jgi:hypothetical protein
MEAQQFPPTTFKDLSVKTGSAMFRSFEISQNYWVFILCPSSDVLEARK